MYRPQINGKRRIFGIEISDEAAEKFLTVEDIVGYLCGVLRHADNQEGTT